MHMCVCMCACACVCVCVSSTKRRDTFLLVQKHRTNIVVRVVTHYPVHTSLRLLAIFSLIIKEENQAKIRLIILWIKENKVKTKG